MTSIAIILASVIGIIILVIAAWELAACWDYGPLKDKHEQVERWLDEASLHLLNLPGTEEQLYAYPAHPDIPMCIIYKHRFTLLSKYRVELYGYRQFRVWKESLLHDAIEYHWNKEQKK